MRKTPEQTVGQTNMALNRSSGTTRGRGILAAILLFSLLHSPMQAAQQVTLIWEPSLDLTVIGHSIYSGSTSGIYTKTNDAGGATSFTISDLIEGATYFFAVTAYDASGLESDLSDELDYTVPAQAPTVRFAAVIAGQFTLALSGPMGSGFAIEATEDFTNWAVIGSVILDASGVVNFTDTNTARFPKRFYRTHQTP